jgi:hypothetical protein
MKKKKKKKVYIDKRGPRSILKGFKWNIRPHATQPHVAPYGRAPFRLPIWGWNWY